MQKYQPRVHVIEVGPNKAIKQETIQTSTFKETQFIAVTSYKNPRVSLFVFSLFPRSTKVHKKYKSAPYHMDYHYDKLNKNRKKMRDDSHE